VATQPEGGREPLGNFSLSVVARSDERNLKLAESPRACVDDGGQLDGLVVGAKVARHDGAVWRAGRRAHDQARPGGGHVLDPDGAEVLEDVVAVDAFGELGHDDSEGGARTLRVAEVDERELLGGDDGARAGQLPVGAVELAGVGDSGHHQQVCL
jgi:hypothetical protein